MSDKLKISSELDPLNALDSVRGTNAPETEIGAENLGRALSALNDNRALAFLLDSISEGVALVRGGDGRIKWANRAFLEAVGENLESLRAGECETRWRGETGNCERCPVARALSSGEIEESLLEDDQGRSWRVKGIPIREDGEITAALELREDVSRIAELDGELERTRREFERRLERQADETRQLIEEREMLIDKTSEFAYRHDDAGVFSYLSPSIERITGYTLEEWSQHYTRYLTDHPDNDWVVQATERTLRTGEKSDPYLVEIYHKNGTRLTLEVDEEPVLEDGGVTGIVGVARDVTDRVVSERIRKEAHRSLQIILDSLPFGIFWKDRDSRYMGCNLRFARDAGKANAEEVTGLSDFDMVWARKAELYREEDFECMESGEGFSDREAHFSLPDGREAWLRSSKVPLRDSSGTVTGVLGLYEDISTSREAKLESRNQLLDLLEEKTRILVEIRDEMSRRKERDSVQGDSETQRSIDATHLSRELTSPLDGAIDLIGQRLRGEMPEVERGELQSAYSSAKTLAGVLGDLIRISDPRSEDAELDAHPFNLETLLGEVVELMRARAVDKSLELELDCASRLPRRVRGDRLRLRQVLLNLLGNAVKYTASGWVRLEVDRPKSGGETMEIVVRDSGEGIDAQRVDELLGHDGRKGYSGGLPTSRKLVEMMGGDLLVESEPNRGTAVRFSVPLPGRDPHPPRERESFESESYGGQRSRVLLVGGGSESRAKLRRILEHARCDVEDTGSYGRGLELSRFGLFDAVLLDCDADREKAGRTARKLMEGSRDETASVLVGLSEGPTPALRGSCRQSGMVDVIDRELEKADLSKLLGKILGGE